MPSFRNEQLKNGVTFQLLTHVTIETTKHTLMNTKINTKLFQRQYVLMYDIGYVGNWKLKSKQVYKNNNGVFTCLNLWL